ncbi:MAG: isoprenylcysteine carboxylmethyltransferase family protein [Anaerolineae bacterium]|nr:isoprenylcysteine carboxylmethyltransferase family protein [Anaerolineae bacterium]NUQ02861.1 isoprenylcysteine carboxylmethyltransferase family protein [Anaerolineae bacterium]
MNWAQAFVAGQMTLFAIFAAAWLRLTRSAEGLLVILGLALIAGAGGLFVLAVVEHQRRNQSLPKISPTPDQRARLVESGLYRHIRHPIYTAVLTGALGAAALHGHLALFAMVAALAAFFTIKARYEESLLRQAYPEYAAYMQRTGRFLPFF